jgi:hypothetical protein
VKKFILALFFFSLASAVKAEVPAKLKIILLDAVAEEVFFEDEGYVRAPQKIEDFTFNQVDEFEFSIQGSSYSEWDDKIIGYDCVATALTRGIIQKTQDLKVSCTLTDENWPHL